MLANDIGVLQFKPIDLSFAVKLCLAYRRDSFACSFGTAQAFAIEGSQDEYLVWLRERLTEWPEGCVHVWHGETIVGQIEMRLRDEPGLGYVNLFYLVPEARGSGAGDQLQAYAKWAFRQLDVTRARLSVSPLNKRAIAYYLKHGWRDLGPRPGREGREAVNLMELALVG